MNMNQLLRSATFAAYLCLAALPSFGQATRTWVSGVGDDANPCSRTAPCRTFAGAIAKTATGGEIDVLDPGGFGALTITKSISIEAVGVIAGVLVSGTNGITIQAGATDKVVLRGLTFDGLGTGLSGISLLSGGALYVQDCTINDFQTGINVAPNITGQTSVFISRTIVRNNSSDGVLFSALSGSSISATLDAVSTEKNGGAGVEAKGGGGVDVSLESSTSANNAVGILSRGPGATINLSNVTVFGNTTGLSGSIGSGGRIVSFGNNRITGNEFNGSPTNPVDQE